MPGEFRTHGEIRAFFLCRRAWKIWKRTNDDTETQMRRLFLYIECAKIPLQVVKKVDEILCSKLQMDADCETEGMMGWSRRESFRAGSA